MTNNQENTNQPSRLQQQLSKKLARISLIIWLISLCLVGFTLSNNDSLRGWSILLWGFFFGWMSPTWWTVYSNLFFIYARFKLLSDDKPKKSVIFMVLLALLLVFAIFGEMKIPLNEAIHYASVVSWGWGAFLLLFAQSLVVLSALLAHNKLSVKSSYVVIGLLIVSLLGIGAYGVWQRIYANEWEYQRYFLPSKNCQYFECFLSAEIAFTKGTLLGSPYTALTETLSDNATVEMVFVGDIAPTIKENESIYPYAFWQNGKYWRKNEKYNYLHDVSDMFIGDTKETRQASYRIEISQPMPNQYLYTLYDWRDNHILYQQPFRSAYFISSYSVHDNFHLSTLDLIKKQRLESNINITQQITQILKPTKNHYLLQSPMETI